MDFYEMIESVAELIMLYALAVTIDIRNKFTPLKLSVFFAALTLIIIILNYFDLPFFTLIVSLFCIIGFMILKNRKRLEVAVDLLLALCLDALIQLSIIQLASLIFLTVQGQVIFRVAVTTVLSILLFILSYKKFFSSFMAMYYRPNKIIIIPAAVLIFVMMMMLSNAKEQDFEYFIKNIQVITTIVILFVVIILLYAISQIRQRYLKDYSRRMIIYSNRQAKIIEELKMNEHDKDASIQSLRRVAGKSRDIENRDELINILDNFDNKKINISRIGKNSGIASLLYDREQMSELIGVELRYTLAEDREYLIPEYDLDRMLLNLINNAIEYEAGMKSITIKKYVKVEFLPTTIIVSNPVDGNLDTEDVETIMSNGYSTKSDERGYGIPSVRKIAEKNDLLFEIDINEGIFTASINVKKKIPPHQNISRI